MSDKKYEDVASEAGLLGLRKERYCNYMRARWAEQESQKCKDGYANEWAHRFLGGYEYFASDTIGKAILDRMHE